MVIAWPDHLYVVEPAPLITVAGRLERKGRREVVARRPTKQDARLIERMKPCVPDLRRVPHDVMEPGGNHKGVAPNLRLRIAYHSCTLCDPLYMRPSAAGRLNEVSGESRQRRQHRSA